MTAPRHQWLCTFVHKKDRVWPEPSGVIGGWQRVLLTPAGASVVGADVQVTNGANH